LVIVPIGGLKDQVTALFEFPLTVAVKVALWPPWSDAFPGDTPMLTFTDGDAGGSETGFPSNTVAVAVLVESKLLVAEIVTSVSCVKEDGA
jgi:hypothetical protein